MNPSLTSNSLKLPLHGQREGTAGTAKPQGNADLGLATWSGQLGEKTQEQR